MSCDRDTNGAACSSGILKEPKITAMLRRREGREKGADGRDSAIIIEMRLYGHYGLAHLYYTCKEPAAAVHEIKRRDAAWDDNFIFNAAAK